jgi:hypothetical protein
MFLTCLIPYLSAFLQTCRRDIFQLIRWEEIIMQSWSGKYARTKGEEDLPVHMRSGFVRIGNTFLSLRENNGLQGCKE